MQFVLNNGQPSIIMLVDYIFAAESIMNVLRRCLCFVIIRYMHSKNIQKLKLWNFMGDGNNCSDLRVKL